MTEDKTGAELVRLLWEIAEHNRKIASYEIELKQIGRLIESTGRSIKGLHLGIDWSALQDGIGRAQSLLTQHANELLATSANAKQLAEIEGLQAKF
jgi:hypothetical protein